MSNATRNRLPSTRPSITHKETVCGKELYVIVGFFDDPPEGWTRHQPAELFVKVAKHGSELSGLIDGSAVIVSVALQHGIPWPTIRDKFRHTRFGSGQTDEYSSILDGIAQMVDYVIANRKRIIGEDEPPAGAPVPAPRPVGPPPQSACLTWAREDLSDTRPLKKDDPVVFRDSEGTITARGTVAVLLPWQVVPAQSVVTVAARP